MTLYASVCSYLHKLFVRTPFLMLSAKQTTYLIVRVFNIVGLHSIRNGNLRVWYFLNLTSAVFLLVKHHLILPQNVDFDMLVTRHTNARVMV